MVLGGFTGIPEHSRPPEGEELANIGIADINRPEHPCRLEPDLRDREGVLQVLSLLSIVTLLFSLLFPNGICSCRKAMRGESTIGPSHRTKTTHIRDFVYPVVAQKSVDRAKPRTLMRTSLTSAVLAAVSALLLNSPLAQAQDTSPCDTGSYAIAITDANNLKGPAYSAVYKSTFDQKLADGNSIHNVSRYHKARDASGKSLTERPGPCYISEDGQQHQSSQVSVYDPKSRTMENWQVDGMNRTATISHMPPPVQPSEAELATMRANAARWRQAPTIPKWQTENLGTQPFQGVLAQGTRSTQTIPAGEQGNALPLVIVNERWFSKELGMTMMQVIDDPRRGRTVVEVEELNQGDPPPSMFAPPEGYEIKDQTTTTTVTQNSPASQ